MVSLKFYIIDYIVKFKHLILITAGKLLLALNNVLLMMSRKYFQNYF